MIEYKTGDILDTKCQAIVIPTNLIGIQGAGLAKQTRHKYPMWNLEYRKWCHMKHGAIGKLHIYRTFPSQYLVGFPTKNHYRNPSKLKYIRKGLKALVKWIDEGYISSVAIPKLGCGYGGLDWEDVQILIEKYLNNHKVHVEVYT